MTVHRKAALAAAIAMGCMTHPLAYAQAALEEIVVTAQKREQSLQDVPISVTAVSGERIDNAGIIDLQELTRYTPNVNINSGQAQPNLFIRGVGSGTNAGFEQSVGMYIDGVYSGRGQLANVPFMMDLQRVEVLKGPQGILFGKNTIGGAINITTQKPTEEFEGYVEGLVAPDDGEQVYTGVVSGKLVDTLSGRLAVRYNAMDGWYEDENLGEKGPNKDDWYLRGSLLFDATEKLSILAKYEYGDFKTKTLPQVVYQANDVVNFQGQQVFPVISDRDKGASDVQTKNYTSTDVYALTINWDLDFAQFTSISAYSAYDTDKVDNSDFSPVAALNRNTKEKFDQWSQELRLVSPGGETVDWIAGAYFEDDSLSVSRLNTALDFALIGPLSVAGALVGTEPGIPSVFDQDEKSWATFAQATWNLAERFRVTGGLRYTDEEKQLHKQTFADGLMIRAGVRLPAANTLVFSNPANQQWIEDARSHDFRGLDRQEDKVTWSGNMQWDATDWAMLYFSVGTGYKAGGYDESYTGAGYSIRLVNPFTGAPVLDSNGQWRTVPGADPSVLDYKPETALAYEIGAKTELFDGAAQLNVAIFRSEYDDLQVSSLVGDVFKVTNAGKAVSQGVETDFRMALSENLRTALSVAYLDASYDDFEGATCTVPQVMDPIGHPGCLKSDGSNIAPPPPIQNGGQDLSGETMIFAPDWSANWNAEYSYPLSDSLELRTGVDVNYSASYYSALDLDPNTKHDGYTVWNARIALAQVDDEWSVAVIGKNLTDEKYNVWNNDVTLQNSNAYFGIPQRPRSFALQARYRF